MFKLFRKKKKRLPSMVENALKEYQNLCLEGCLKIPCKKCRHLTKINEHRYTCKREQIMNILIPNYKQEIERIDRGLRK